MNIDPDMSYFAGIISCGLADLPVASLADIMEPVPSMEEVEDRLTAAFAEVFGYQVVAGEPEEILIGDKKP